VKLDFLENGQLDVNEVTFETNYHNVYAGGDAIRGADSLINAIGDGKKIAQEIIRKIDATSKSSSNKSVKPSLSEFQLNQATRKYGKSMPEISLSDRNNFELVHPSLSKEEAIEEASRCLLCDDVCNICVGVCPNFANVSFTSTPEKIPIYQIEKRGQETVTFLNSYFEVNQKPQIFNIGDFCNECGNCNTFCPTSGAPYLTKPKFYLTQKSFDAEDNCYYINGNQIIYKNGEVKHFLKIESEKLIYTSDEVEMELDKIDYTVTDYKIISKEFDKIVLSKASEMIFLLKNLNNKIVFN